MSSPKAKYYTSKEAAEYLRVNVLTIRHWYRTGKIKGIKPNGKNILFTKEQLDAVLESDNKKSFLGKLLGK